MHINGFICQSGGKKMNTGKIINEDGLANFEIAYNNEEYKFIILMDGASGLGKNHEIAEGLTSAEWYVKFMISEIKKILSEVPILPLEEVVEKAIAKAINEVNNYENKHNVTLTEYEKPSAGLSLMRTSSKTTDIFLIGDTETIIGYKNGKVSRVENPNQKALQKLDHSVISRMAEIAKQKNCNVIDTMSIPEIQSMLQINRTKKNANCEDCYWVCGTTPETAQHGICVTLDNTQIEGIILATDGFDYSMLNLNEKEVYSLVKKFSTDYVSMLIRNAQTADAKCNKFPRFKTSDDLTVVFSDYRQREITNDKDKSILR